MKQKLSIPGPIALMHTPGLPVNLPAATNAVDRAWHVAMNCPLSAVAN
jgi:hypothetical protein